MLKAFIIIGAVLLVAVIAVLVYATTKPDAFRVQRTITIKAPPEKIFALINDFHEWPKWSPYEGRDPAMQRTFGGPAAGKGAVYEWSGNNNIGAGRMEILDAPAPSRIMIKLDFLRPFEGHNTAEFTLQPQGDATTVTWAMYGPTPFISKLMSVFLDMDKMIGTDFAIGLANLKAQAEK